MYTEESQKTQRRSTTANRMCDQTLKLNNLYGQYKFEGDNSRLIIGQSDVIVLVSGCNNFLQFTNTNVELTLAGDNNMINLIQSLIKITLNGSKNVVEVNRDDYCSEIIDFVSQTGASNSIKKVNVFTTQANSHHFNFQKMKNNTNGAMNSNIFSTNRSQSQSQSQNRVNYYEMFQNNQNAQNLLHQEDNNSDDEDSKMELQIPKSQPKNKNCQRRFVMESNQQQFQQNSVPIKKSVNVYKRGNWNPQEDEYFDKISNSQNKNKKLFNNFKEKEKEKQNDSYRSNHSNQRQRQEEEDSRVNNRQDYSLMFRPSSHQQQSLRESKNLTFGYNANVNETVFNQNPRDNNKIRRGNWDPNTQTEIQANEHNQSNNLHLFKNKNNSNILKNTSTSNIFNNQNNINGSQTQRQKTSFQQQSSSRNNIFSRNYQPNSHNQNNNMNRMFGQVLSQMRIKSQRQKKQLLQLQLQKMKNPQPLFKNSSKKKQTQKQQNNSFDSTKAVRGGQNNRSKKPTHSNHYSESQQSQNKTLFQQQQSQHQPQQFNAFNISNNNNIFNTNNKQNSNNSNNNNSNSNRNIFNYPSNSNGAILQNGFGSNDFGQNLSSTSQYTQHAQYPGNDNFLIHGGQTSKTRYPPNLFNINKNPKNIFSRNLNNSNNNQNNQKSKKQLQKPPNIPPISVISSNNNNNNNNRTTLSQNQSHQSQSLFPTKSQNNSSSTSQNRQQIPTITSIFNQSNNFNRINNNNKNFVSIFEMQRRQRQLRQKEKEKEKERQQKQRQKRLLDARFDNILNRDRDRSNERNEQNYESNLTARFGPRAMQLRYDQDVISVSDSDSQSMPVDVPQGNYGSTYVYNNTTSIFNIGSRYDFSNEMNERNIFSQYQVHMSSNNLFNGGGGLTPVEISKLPKSLNTHSSDMVCQICMSEVIKNEEEITFLFCFHHYHSDCIQRWLSRNATCPNCKHDVREGLRDDKSTSKKL